MRLISTSPVFSLVFFVLNLTGSSAFAGFEGPFTEGIQKRLKELEQTTIPEDKLRLGKQWTCYFSYIDAEKKAWEVAQSRTMQIEKTENGYTIDAIAPFGRARFDSNNTKKGFGRVQIDKNYESIMHRYDPREDRILGERSAAPQDGPSSGLPPMKSMFITGNEALEYFSCVPQATLRTLFFRGLATSTHLEK